MKTILRNVGGLACGAIVLLGLVTGCGKSTAQKASESDANGYVCLDCKGKFSTDRSVFADTCPDCKSVNLEPVYGYVCEVDPVDKPEGFKPGCGAVTLAPRGASVKCQKCGERVNKVSLPSGDALAQWGAKKAAKDKVLIPR